MTKDKKGFTLIELVVVMAIIGVLAALMVAAISAARNQATNTQRIGNVKAIETALETRSSKCGGKYFAAGGSCAASTLSATSKIADIDTFLKSAAGAASLSSSVVTTADNDNGYFVTALDSSSNTYTIVAKDNSGNVLYTATR